MGHPQFIPQFSLLLDGQPAPLEMRASVQAVECKTGYDGLDELECTLANERLRWLDSDLFPLGTGITLALGYAPKPLTQVFDGEVVARGAGFPAGGIPTFSVTAHDRRHKMATGNKLRWFAIPLPDRNLPLPDPATASIVALENGMEPAFEPVGFALSVLLGGADAFAAFDPISSQKVVRKQANTSDYQFLETLAKENGWDMLVEHAGERGGHKLRFTSSLDRLSTDHTLRYGSSLIDFSPRVSTVGQIASVSGFVWVPPIKTTFIVTLGFDFERQALTLSIYPGVVPIGIQASDYLIEEPLTLTSIPRRLVSELIPKLNNRLTASGSIVGNAQLRPGDVLRIEGVGKEFGGLYRATAVTHSFDSSGFRTRFEARKEIWFGSIPPADQGAVPVRVTF
jgi:phage protein D